MANQREQFCADSFDQFIASHLQIKEKKWESVPKGQDPPDFFLMLDQTTFAVEITSTEVMRDVSIGEGQIQEKTYEHTHTRFIKGIENIARESGILKEHMLFHFIVQWRILVFDKFGEIFKGSYFNT